ncbi:MAG: hypothetical protein CM15mP74_11750 [Halieaceae bacterium]|nr:MAG: hypothetical protein CM15mP74_11750 [Halieaceae bacterium]
MREAVLRMRALCLTSFKAVAVSAMFLGGAVLLDPVTRVPLFQAPTHRMTRQAG